MIDAGLKKQLSQVQGLRRVHPGVVEIVTYSGRAAALAWLVAIGVLVALAMTTLDAPDPLFPSLSDRIATQLGHGLIWGPIGDHQSYIGCVERQLYDGCRPDLTRSEYYFEIFLPRSFESGALTGLAFLAILCAAPFLYLLFWRRPPPVRIDGHRRIVYTWRWGRLYIARYTTHHLVVPSRRRFDAVAGDARSGPVRLRLSSGRRHKVFTVGPFSVFPNETRASEAWILAKSVLGSDPDAITDALPAKFAMPWWTRTSILGPRHLPAHAAAQVDIWCDANRDLLPD